MPRDLTVDVSFTKPSGMLPLEIIVFWDAEDKTEHFLQGDDGAGVRYTSLPGQHL